ncbi:unnamed protein product [Orchesella dallaii]|uniref:Uncharacterized protein n=1 Tax=Orchesella dallaii TaxID=48710 RepID=A0ABP1S4X8_9HEXA
MFNKLQSMFGKPHRVQPSHLESCITLETSQTKSETPFSQAPQELSITVSTSDDRNEDSKSDTTATHDHDEQAEELISNETSTNPNDVDNEKASLAGLEMLLRVDYYLGLSPFRLSTQGKAVSCCGSKAASFKLWFISKKTVKVLQMDQKEYQAKLEEINTIPLGIGTDAFYTHIGFIASLFGVVLTYFFLATDAISDSR